MLPFLQFLIILAVIITAAKLGGYFSVRLGQPAVAGEVLAGLILGPTVLNFLHWDIFTDVHLEETITFLAELGVLLLLFIAGLELHISDLQKSGRAAVFAGVLGFLVPLGFGYLVAILMGFDPQQGLFIGLLLAPTSVSISAQTLMELGALRSRVGASLLGGAVIDDTLVVLGISIYLAVLGGSGSQELSAGSGILLLVGRMILYIALAIFVGIVLLPRFARWTERLPISEGVIAFAFTVMIFYAWSAEYLGSLATIIGAFLAGLFFARTPLKAKITQGFSAIAYGVFVPIFFVDVGLEANFRALDRKTLAFLGILLAAAIVSKIIGSGLGGLLGKLSVRESVQLGFSMVPRGEVVLIVATVGITEGFISQTEVSIAVAMVVLTTLLTPPVLRLMFRKGTQSNGQVTAMTDSDA
ncbi:MAG: cation:proton antiporter [Anaerolineales bacterium]|nr:cation:proton antiporter [Anaerolineales bacterium]